jgi:RHS repeat-associated protein
MNPFRTSHKTQAIRAHDPYLSEQTSGVCLQNTYDYSPFGVSLDGRKMEGDFYRYGFQGQEEDDEIKGVGNSMNYEYRMHDPRIGRFFAIDPLAKDYPWNSPYSFAINSPIQFVEILGMGPGDLFATPEDAAKDFGKNYNDNSIVLKKEIASAIVKRVIDGKAYFTYIQPSLGSEAESTPPSRPDMPTVARIHTHGNYSPEYDNNHFSPTDMNNADNLKVNSYVVTPNGSIRKYNYKTKKVTQISTSMPSDPKDPDRLNKVSPYGTPKNEPTYDCWIWTKHWILNPLGDALQNINDSKQVNSSPEVDLSKPLDDTELKLDISE